MSERIMRLTHTLRTEGYARMWKTTRLAGGCLFLCDKTKWLNWQTWN